MCVVGRSLKSAGLLVWLQGFDGLLLRFWAHQSHKASNNWVIYLMLVYFTDTTSFPLREYFRRVQFEVVWIF